MENPKSSASFSGFCEINLKPRLLYKFLTNIKLKPSVPRGVAIATLFVVLIGMGKESYGAFRPNINKLFNWTNDAMFKEIHQHGEYLLTAPGLYLLPQLYTRASVFPGNIIGCLA